MSISTNTRTTWTLIQQANTKAGTVLPKALTKAWDDLNALAATRLPRFYDPGALVEATAAAIREDRDPLDDPIVTRQLLARQLDGLGPESLLTQHVDAHRAQVLTEHSEALVKAWQAIIVTADETLHEARTAGLDLSQTVTDSTPPAALAMLGRAREARDQVVAIASAWQALMEATGQAQPRGRMALALAPLSRSQYLALGQHRTAAAVVEKGHRLSLATAQEFAERVVRLETDAAAEAQRNEQDQQHALRTRLGAGQSISV